EGLSGSVVDQVALVPPPGTTLPTTRARVEIDFAAEQGIRQIGPLPVVVRPAAGVAAEAVAGVVVEPAEVEVVLRGGVLALDRVDPSTLEVRITLGPGDLGAGPGRTHGVRTVPGGR